MTIYKYKQSIQYRHEQSEQVRSPFSSLLEQVHSPLPGLHPSDVTNTNKRHSQIVATLE